MKPRAGFDYIVVGAGAAGCIVASRLSEDPAVQVLLIEAGGSDRALKMRIPLLTFVASATADLNWSYLTEPIPALNGRRQTWNQGRVIGGSGSVNGMVYTRGHATEYDAWQTAGCDGWSFADVLPFFKKIEADSRGEGPWHGGRGKIPIRPSRLDPPICKAFIEALKESGHKILDDLNAADSEGFGRYDCNIGRGLRMSSAATYLRAALSRPNLTVMKNTVALRVLTAKQRATAVEVVHQGCPRTLYANAEIVLCGGALNSPALLMASGIGPADYLREVGVASVIDSPEVGENLKNHPAYLMPYFCTAPVTAYRYMSPLRGLGALLNYAVLRKGPLAETFASIGGTIRSAAGVDFPDTLVGLVPSLIQRASGSAPRWWELLPREHGITLLLALGHPHSTGRVRLRSDTPGDAPLIYPNYFADERDIAALVGSMQVMRRVMQQHPIAKYIDPNRGTAAMDGDPAALVQALKAGAGTFSHPSGTCRMGSDARSVVDTRLRVRGISGLRIADNSIMPRALNAFGHAPALMIGERASAFIRATRPPESGAAHSGQI